MELIVLGCNGTFPTPGRPASGYLLHHEQTTIWIDTGPGTFAALQDVMSYQALDAIIITHIHADHSSDLIGYYHAVKYGPGEHNGITVYAPDLVEERLAYYVGGSGYDFGDVLSFETVGDASQVTGGDSDLRFALTDHPVPTVSVRAEAGGRVVAYSSDTGPQGTWPAIADNAGVFLCEATYQGHDKPFEHHLTATEAGEIARRQQAGRLVLTHIWPFLQPERSIAEAEQSFGKPVELAAPGRTIRI
jgi:ribonuclease BN (tRNA processing enzyme)